LSWSIPGLKTSAGEIMPIQKCCWVFSSLRGNEAFCHCSGYFPVTHLVFIATGNLNGNTNKMMCSKCVETSSVNECAREALSASLQLLCLPGLESLLQPGFS